VVGQSGQRRLQMLFGSMITDLGGKIVSKKRGEIRASAFSKSF
jgi:hypothetical protein